MINRLLTIIFLLLSASFNNFAQIVVRTDEMPVDNYSTEEVLGFKLRSEVLAIIKEIERKSGE